MLRCELIVVNLVEYFFKKLVTLGYIVYWYSNTKSGPKMDYISPLSWFFPIFYCNLRLFCAKYSSLPLKNISKTESEHISGICIQVFKNL
jgi:hypothetical protein